MTGVGQPARIGAVGERRVDILADGDATEGHVARRHALGEGHQIRDDVKVLDGEPFSGPAETRHHLVGDEHDAVLIADCTDPGQVSGRRNHDSRCARHGFEDERSERRGSLVLDQPIQIVQRAFGFLLLVLGVKRRAI